MTISRGLWLAAAILGLAAVVEGAANEAEPHLGYVYPAGGRQGTTVRVVAGGQDLRGGERVSVSGRGVRASVVGASEIGRPLKPEQLKAIGQRLRELAAARPPRGEAAEPLPDHPFLRHLDDLTARELKKVREFFFDPSRKVQASPQIAETLEVEVTIDADAPPGDRELRIEARGGLTNPVLFQVGTLPEVAEQEINDFRPMALPELRAPLVLNGQIFARDVDRFRFQARRGQKLVFAAQARRLVPYIADAVPGWFQATLALRDAQGVTVGFADDYRFDPDPVLFHEVAADGELELEVRDAIYRGRGDFVYRITAGEVPFVTRIFPLGGRVGVSATAAIAGWNLPRADVALDTRPGDPARELAIPGSPLPVRYAVDDLPELAEAEPNDLAARAQPVLLPCIVNGCIDRAGDVDVFRLEGRAGDEVVAEVVARRLGSPIDSGLALTGAAGRVLARSDDTDDRGAGLVTHPADAALRLRLPADGSYLVRLVDVQGHGGAEYAYRLRISAPRPDFSLIVTPSGLNVPAGSFVDFTVHALRRDGFDGEIEVALRGAPPGFALNGSLIPAGRDSARMTLMAPRDPGAVPTPLALEGRARVAGRAVTRRATPADEATQAFVNRHLVPARELLVAVTRSRRGVPRMALAGDGLVRVPEGGEVEVRLEVPRMPPLAGLRFELSDPPKGVTLGEVRAIPGGFAVVLRAEAGAAKAGLRENLIVDVYAEVEAGGGPGKAGTPPPARATRRVYVGALPAIPVVVEAPCEAEGDRPDGDPMIR